MHHDNHNIICIIMDSQYILIIIMYLNVICVIYAC